MALTQTEFEAVEIKIVAYYVTKKAWLKKLATSLLAEFVLDNDVSRQEELLGYIHAVRDKAILWLQESGALEYMQLNGVPEDINLSEAKDIIGSIPKNLNQASKGNGKKSIQGLIDAYV